jgi:hypothetical protein
MLESSVEDFFFFLLDITFSSTSFKSFQGFLCLFLCFCTREGEKEKEREFAYLFQDTSVPHLVSFFLAPPFPALLVGRGVTTQAPSSSSNNNNTNNTNNNNNSNKNTSKRNSRTQSQKKSITFNIKQHRVVFLELNYKEGKKT